MPTFREVLTLPVAAAEERLREPAVRDRMRAELADPTGRSFVFAWDGVRVERVVQPHNERWLDRSVGDIAQATDVDPLDAFLDLCLDEHLETQFVVARPPSPERLAATERMITSPVTMAGSSDGGAHLLSFCGADYTTRLLAEWVPSVLTIEQAVARLTSVPARATGITDRGALLPGMAADVLVIDRDTLDASAPRYTRDFPADSGRFVVDASGYRSTIVNGEVLHDDGVWTGATPGQILRA
jgi:N-acyl-D-amino-acid deacylase